MRAALRLVWALDVRHLVAHRTRLALSALGIAVGVALAVSVGSLSSSITGSLEDVTRAAAQDANIEVRPNGNAGIDPSLLAKVRSAGGVRNAGATIESYVRVRHDGNEVRVLAFGVDSGILEMSPGAADRATITTSDPLGLIVPRDIADEIGVRAGDEIEITTPSGWKAIKVGTVIEGAAGSTRVVVGTVGVLQQMLERGDRYDAIYVEADDPDAGLRTVGDAVGEAARVGPVAFRSEQLEQLLASAGAAFAVGSLVAMFVGAFLVYNTMAMAAVERLQEMALLRAVGAKRRQVFLLFLAEGGVLGLIGSVAGVGLGVVMASQLLTRQGTALEQVYPIQITSLDVSPRVLVGAGLAGVIAAVVAAYLPARRISRTDPAPALGPAGTYEDPMRKPRTVINVIAAACCAIGALIAVLSMRSGEPTSGATMAGMAITLAGIALLIPTVVPLIAGVLLGRIASMKRSGGVLRLATGEVLRSPGRTSFTVGAVVLSLALVVGFSIAQTSFTHAFDAGFEDIISADMYVRSPTWRPFGSDVPMDDRIAGEIEQIDGVRAAWPFRLMPATLEDRAIIVLAYDLDRYATYSRTDGAAKRDVQEQARAVGDGDAVLASASFLSQFSREIGDTITLPTPTGAHELRIADGFSDPSAITPEIIFDHATFKRIWGSGGADTFGVVADDETQVADVRTDIERTLGPRYGFDVDSRDEYFDLLSTAVGSIAQLLGSVQLAAVMVAALGLANTLLISILERRRDLGVLRAVGMLRGQLRRMVAIEALLIGVLGVLMAWGLGTLIGVGMYKVIETQLGVPITGVFPPMGYAGAAILGVASALAASIYPSRRAARLDVVEALQYE